LSTNVYIDAFNLHYGCLKGTPYQWLDLGLLCRLLLPGYAVNRTVTSRPSSSHGPTTRATSSVSRLAHRKASNAASPPTRP